MITIDSITGTNFGYNKVPLERWLDDMVTLERTELELWGVSQHIDLFALTLQSVHRLRREFDARGLHLHCVTPEQIMYPVNVASDDPAIVEMTMRMFRNAADLSAELGGKLLFLTGGWGWEGEPIDDARKRSAERLHELAEYAGSLGLRSVLEALQRSESNLDVGLEQLGDLFEAADSAHLGIALDTVAMATSNESITDYFDRFDDRVWHVHLVDGSPSGHKAWGDGDLPLDTYLTELRRVGYEGLLTAEIFGAAYTYDPTTAHTKNLAAIREAFARIDSDDSARTPSAT